MKIAIVHYWLVGMRGGEKVLEQLCDIYPEADIYTHVYNPEKISEKIKEHRVKTTFINQLPFAVKQYKNYLPFMPIALESLDLRGYELVISIESGPAKGVLTSSDAVHINICCTPMRYIWDMYHDYRNSAGKLKRLLMSPLTHYLRLYDFASSARVDNFIAISNLIKRRIYKTYRREAEVIYPPVACNNFKISDTLGDYYLMVGQLVRYKRADLAVNAFNRIKKKLVIIGEGELLSEIKKEANQNINILGWQSSDVIRDYYSKCKALIFPGEEDFGIVPVEVMASGRPVIAYGRGGALDTIVDGGTGLFFYEQTAESLIDCVERFEEQYQSFSPERIREHAFQFDDEVFKGNIKQYVAKCIKAHDSNFVSCDQRTYGKET